MIYRTISLYDLINQKVGEKAIKGILSDFSCPLNEDVDYFIHYKAYDFERVGLARTYLVYALIDDKPILVAFYSLGQSNVVISEDLSKNMKKKIFGTTYPIGKNIKTLLIGQLSKNFYNGYNQYIAGDILMGLVFEKIKEIHLLFPSVVIHIDCRNDIHLKRFYEKMGFQLFKENGDMLIYFMPTNNVVEKIIS
ncbi:hypothetical protein [Dielma fastidiosa]|uniref:hypothetical protein n=1 Tax=Dielma fastidiosa TaxID=1034346 RepID=UPI00356AD25D